MSVRRVQSRPTQLIFGLLSEAERCLRLPDHPKALQALRKLLNLLVPRSVEFGAIRWVIRELDGMHGMRETGEASGCIQDMMDRARTALGQMQPKHTLTQAATSAHIPESNLQEDRKTGKSALSYHHLVNNKSQLYAKTPLLDLYEAAYTANEVDFASFFCHKGELNKRIPCYEDIQNSPFEAFSAEKNRKSHQFNDNFVSKLKEWKSTGYYESKSSI